MQTERRELVSLTRAGIPEYTSAGARCRLDQLPARLGYPPTAFVVLFRLYCVGGAPRSGFGSSGALLSRNSASGLTWCRCGWTGR